MNRKLITISLITAVAAIAFALVLVAGGKRAPDSIVGEFREANRCVAAGEHAAAIGAYEALIENGQQSAAIFHNLAVAHHRSGDLGQAILNYERAATLDPGPADIRANLERARKDSATTEEHTPTPLSLAKSLSVNTWSLLASTSLAILALLAIGRSSRLIDWPKSVLRLVAGVALIVTAAAAGAISLQHRELENRAIITADTASLRVSPFDQARSLSRLTPGKAVHLIDGRAHGDYRLARLESGQSGWIKISEFERPTITAK